MDDHEQESEHNERMLYLLAEVFSLHTNRVARVLAEYRIRTWEEFKKIVERSE